MLIIDACGHHPRWLRYLFTRAIGPCAHDCRPSRRCAAVPRAICTSFSPPTPPPPPPQSSSAYPHCYPNPLALSGHRPSKAKMPDLDINPATIISRPSISLSTPVLSTKSITVSAPSVQKAPKTSQLIPPRIDLEPIYTKLKALIEPEQWPVYRDATTQFLIGRLNQAEYSERVDPILYSASGEKEHYHNQLLAAIYGNVTREMPDQGLAPWVSANDKPSGVGSKPVSGDATERRLKGEVMQLPNRDRRRIKDIIHNDYDPFQQVQVA
ncbi:hypothetical protein VTK73DRAFT_4767 [Phialemonium thermophilum]|uniref:Uncharacterized protein n=1 Tax=Phialemonium thermophilum TaxID=223376 RepID=A0ABR3V639_9PEZI